MNVIELNELTKKYGNFTAVDNVSFEVKEGEIFGFLGPNGAGKTTTVSMLSTLKEPTSGTAKVNGYDVVREQEKVRESIGIVFQDPSLDEELTAYENLKFHAIMYELDDDTTEKRVSELLKLVGLQDRRDVLVSNFSGGMKRRLEIARGLMHYPKVLFLDEPTIGLDPQTRHLIWEYVEKLNQEENVTVILTTHYMEEAERLANRIAIMDHGKIIAIDTSEGLQDLVEGETVSLQTSQPEKLSNNLQELEWVDNIQTYNEHVDVTLKNGREYLPLLFRNIFDYNLDIRSISVRKPTLEDVYIRLTGKSIREESASSKDGMRLASKMGGRR